MITETTYIHLALSWERTEAKAKCGAESSQRHTTPVRRALFASQWRLRDAGVDGKGSWCGTYMSCKYLSSWL